MLASHLNVTSTSKSFEIILAKQLTSVAEGREVWEDLFLRDGLCCVDYCNSGMVVLDVFPECVCGSNLVFFKF